MALHQTSLAAAAACEHAAKRHCTEAVPHNDATSTYMQELLQPQLEQLPPFSELPAFVSAPLMRKLVCQDCDYTAVTAKAASMTALLLPVSQVPTAQSLARIISNVLNSRFRDVRGKAMLHHNVDMLFEDMFRLAADAGLLFYNSDRSSGVGLRPDFMLWVRNALLLKGEERSSSQELDEAECDILARMTSPWNADVYGECPYMFAYAVAGRILELFAVQDGLRLLLLKADMSTDVGKRDMLVAVVHITRALRAMSRNLPNIRWGVGQLRTVKENGETICRVINMGGYVRKELRHFQTYHSQYATLAFLRSAYEAIARAAAAGGATQLVHARKLPELIDDEHVIIETAPVGLAYTNSLMPHDEEEAKLAIRGAVEGCGQLHALGIAHRDLRWPNLIKVIEDGQTHVKVIDFDKSGVLDAVCEGWPYPLPYWEYNDGTDRTVTEPNKAYSARSDFRMIGKKLMARLLCLGRSGQDLRRRLEDGEYQAAAEVLAHEWFQ